MTTTTPVTFDQLVAAGRLTQAKEAKRAGRALHHYDAVLAELTAAETFFSSGDYGNANLIEVAQAGGRIERLARQLAAADRHHSMGRVVGRWEQVGEAPCPTCKGGRAFDDPAECPTCAGSRVVSR